jgi:hypothetical protein
MFNWHLVKNVTLVKFTNTKYFMSFMSLAFSQGEHHFYQWKHFNQVEPYKKLPFLVVGVKCLTNNWGYGWLKKEEKVNFPRIPKVLTL